ncbi:MAG: DUF4093 domain-containing protein [Anaerotruncus colihominis]
MLRVRQAIIVEGRYDKAKLHSLVDATIVTTDGFGVFRNRESSPISGVWPRRPESSSYRLRRSRLSHPRLSGGRGRPVAGDACLHPDLFERSAARHLRRRESSAWRKSAQTLLAALRRAGVAVEETSARPARKASSADASARRPPGRFCGLGAVRRGGAARRRALLSRLGLPERMSANAMLAAVNALYTPEEFERLLAGMPEEKGTHRDFPDHPGQP